MVHNKVIVFAYFWIFVGLISVYYALQYGFFSAGIPQAGFFPAIAGSVLCLLGSINIISIHRQAKSGIKSEKKKNYRVISIIFTLFFYVAFFQIVGFLILTPITIYIILRLIQFNKKSFLIAVSVIGTALLYLIFHILLRIQFPRGNIF